MKEANPKGYILYDSNYMTFWKRENCGDSKKIRSCHGVKGGMTRQSTEDFLGRYSYYASYHDGGYMSL